MRWKLVLVSCAMLAAAAVPSANAHSCVASGYESVGVPDLAVLYVWQPPGQQTPEIWAESNGEAGLQRNPNTGRDPYHLDGHECGWGPDTLILPQAALA